MVKFRRFPPPLSSGPGRGPLKAETRVRTSLGAHNCCSWRVFISPALSSPWRGPKAEHEFEPRWGHSEGHPSAAQLYNRVKRQFPTMSHATVYKTLALLEEMNQVLEIDLRNDSHYDGIRPQPHLHLICVNCKKIIDGEVSIDKE